MLIRTEAPADILTIDRLVKSAFPTEAEANLVMKLRENSNLTLSLVACSDEGEVIGHVMFSPVTLNGEHLNWQGLAPISVKEEFRGQGIAKALVEEAHSTLRDFGYPVVAVLGDPEFYAKFGYQYDERFTCPWEVPEGVFRVIELVEGSLASQQGLIEYSPEFSEL